MRGKLLVAVIFLVSCQSKQETYTVESKPIVESVYASARLRAEGQYDLSTAVGGRVIALFKQEGDPVKAGELIAVLEADKAQAQLAGAEAALRAADGYQTQVQSLLNNYQMALLNRRDDSLFFERQNRLYEKGIGSRLQWEKAELKYQFSRNQSEAARSAYLDGQRKLAAARDQAKSAEQLARSARGDYQIRALEDGKLYSWNVRVGETVAPQRPIATLGSALRFYAELQIDEVDAARVKYEQKVALRLDAFPDQIITGKLRQIDQQVDPKSGTIYLECQLDSAQDAALRLFPGLSAEASIVIQEKESAVVLPLIYLKNGKVTLVNGDQVKPKLGIQSINMVEVLEGLKAGDELVKPQ